MTITLAGGTDSCLYSEVSDVVGDDEWLFSVNAEIDKIHLSRVDNYDYFCASDALNESVYH